MLSDWIFVRWFAENVRSLSMRQIVEGALHEKPSFWYTGEVVLRDGMMMPSASRRMDTELVLEMSKTLRSPHLTRTKLLASLSHIENSSKEANAAWRNSANSVLAQKSGLVVISFLQAFTRDNGFGLFGRSLDQDTIQSLVKRRDAVMAFKRRQISDDTFEDDTAVLQQYYDALSYGNTGIQTQKLGSQEEFAGKQFFCRAMSANDLRAVLRLNMGPMSVDYIMDKSGNRLFSTDEICNRLAEKTLTALQVVDVQGAWFRRKVVFYLGQFLMTVSGWYTCINDLHVSTTGTRDMAPTLLAIAAVAKYANPLSILMQAIRASIASLAVQSVSTLLMVVPPLAFGMLMLATRYSRTFDLDVKAGSSVHWLSNVPVSPARQVEDGVSKFGVAEALATRTEVTNITKSMERFDTQVRDVIKQFKQHPDRWERERVSMRRDFDNACADFDGPPQSLSSFLSQYNLDKTRLSRLADAWDVRFFGLPQQFLSVLKPTLTLEDIIDAHGRERNSHEICAAVYLRTKTEAQPFFDSVFGSMSQKQSD